MSNYVTGAARLCKNQRFWEFLGHRTRLEIGSPDDAASSLCYYLQIQSRRELATNDMARQRYVKLVQSFNLWLRAPR